MDYDALAMEAHRRWRGKLEIKLRAELNDARDLSIAYTPGVAAPCLAIKADPSLSFELTRRWNTVAVITDGTAVLGLGDIGPLAGMPVMEGKCALFKAFADIDAIPICVGSRDTDEIVRAVSLISGSFGAINLEDISAPRCFEIERRLKLTTDIPVFHDDQHGTAVVTMAALINALRLTGRSLPLVRIAISGAGAAGLAIARMLLRAGAVNITLVNSKGIVAPDLAGASADLAELAAATNPERRSGGLSEAVRGADVFIGVSAPGILTEGDVRAMAPDPIVMAMANPVPEIAPELARRAGASVVATGRSDYPNQVNNVLAFPGILRGALDARAKDITEEMKLAAAEAIARIAEDDGVTPDYVIPNPLDKRVARRVAESVQNSAFGDAVKLKPRKTAQNRAKP
ncbi:MAG: NADP-dependent malic enzyme [Clostridiales bacterium]|jgi:malate dehydrogenase (oxaloacetate-decarboxylating)|nr:NADP-dependent malic enzyme [Clostridiales bacterium]